MECEIVKSCGKYWFSIGDHRYQTKNSSLADLKELVKKFFQTRECCYSQTDLFDSFKGHILTLNYVVIRNRFKNELKIIMEVCEIFYRKEILMKLGDDYVAILEKIKRELEDQGYRIVLGNYNFIEKF